MKPKLEHQNKFVRFGVCFFKVDFELWKFVEMEVEEDKKIERTGEKNGEKKRLIN